MKMMLSPWRKISLALTLLALGAAGSPSLGKPLTIMPLGDSITYGYTTPVFTPGGYRAPLLQDLTAMGYQVQFVGSDTTNSSPALDLTGNSHHEGHSGFTIDNIANNLDGSDNSIFVQSGLPSSGNDGGYWFTGYDQMAQVWVQGIAAVSPVPEPATGTIFAAGAVALAALGLRVRRKKSVLTGKANS